MPVVTISGQIGTGAHELGRLVADRLKLDYIDQEILVGAAQRLGVPMESVVPFDERHVGLGERLAGTLRRFLERSAQAGAADIELGTGGLDVLLSRTYGEAVAGEDTDVSDERYRDTLTEIVRELATHDNVLIIGRGSQAILGDALAACNVLLVAPEVERIAQFAEREGLSEHDATKQLRDRDLGRVEFHKKFFKVKVDDPALYHVTINTARCSLDEAAAIIAAAAQAGAQRAGSS